MNLEALARPSPPRVEAALKQRTRESAYANPAWRTIDETHRRRRQMAQPAAPGLRALVAGLVGWTGATVFLWTAYAWMDRRGSFDLVGPGR